MRRTANAEEIAPQLARLVYADANPETKTHARPFVRKIHRPYVHGRACHERKHVVALIDAAHARSGDSPAQREEAAGRIVERLDVAGQRDDEASLRRRVLIRPLRAIERIGDDLDFGIVGAIAHVEDLAAPDDIRVVIAFRLTGDFGRCRRARRRILEYRCRAARERSGGRDKQQGKAEVKTHARTP